MTTLATGKDKFAVEKDSSTTLNELVQRSKNLPKRLEEFDTLRLSLNEIQKRAYDLRKFNKRDGDQNAYTKAHYLLIGKGIKLEDIGESIENAKRSLYQKENNQAVIKSDLHTSKSLAQPKPSNLSIYMNKKKDEDVLMTIESSLTTAAKDFDTFVNKNINLDWKQRKLELRSKLSAITKRDLSNPITSSPDKKSKKLTQKELMEKQLTWGAHKTKSLISSNFVFNDVQPAKSLDSVVNPNVSYALRQKFQLNAEVIYELNEARQSKDWYKLATAFSTLYKKELAGNKSDQIYQALVILRDFFENSQEDTDDKLRPGKYYKATHSKLNEFEAIKLRETIVQKSRNYLEQQFRDYLVDLYETNKVINPKEQDISLIPTIISVLNFIELTLKTKQKTWKIPSMTFVNGLPLWAILFYLLRAGCYEEAVILVSKYEDSFQKLEKSFPLYLRTYCESEEKRLPEDLQGRLNNEFNQYFKNSNKDIDPFRYAVYKLLGRCDLSSKTLPSITLSIEDWLWLHFSLIKEDETVASYESYKQSFDFNDESENIVNEKYRLIDLQNSILKFEPEVFNASTNNPMYLQTLLLVGLYEDAVKYLMYQNEIDAVHLAITLNYYGLLRVSDEVLNPAVVNNLINVDNDGFKSVNFARMIGHYVKSFKFSDPRVAAEYLFLVCMNGEESQIKICQEAIRELVLETREFVILLGKITKTGMRIPGVIEERKVLIHLDDEKSFLDNISEKAAQRANEDGRLIDCILLYQLSEEYDTVLTIVNKLLGDFLNSIDLMNSSDSINELLYNAAVNGETNIIKLAEDLMRVYNSSTNILSKTSIKNRSNCKKLLEMFDIMRDFNNTSSFDSKCNQILEKIKALELVPITSDDDISKIRNLIQEFNNYDSCIMKNIPNLLMIEMTCLQRLILINDNSFKATELKQISKNCMIFAGLIKYKMPREMYTLLINLEINK